MEEKVCSEALFFDSKQEGPLQPRLLSGPRGTGKRERLRVWAKALSCRQGNGEACSCPSCHKIDAGIHPDVRWLGEDVEKKSIKIEDVRELQSWLSLKPFESDWKVVGVFEAERLTLEAQNAFLKILEEPPAYALIAFTSISPLKLLPTILSRLQEIRIKPMASGELKGHLRRKGLAEEAHYVAYQSRGSLRVAETFMERDYLDFRRQALEAFFKGRVLFFLKDLETKAKGTFPLLVERASDVYLALLRDLLIVRQGNPKTVGDLLAHADFHDEIVAFASNCGKYALVTALEKLRQCRQYLGDYVNVKMVASTMAVVLNPLTHGQATGGRP